jgi:hypothetical protein
VRFTNNEAAELNEQPEIAPGHTAITETTLAKHVLKWTAITRSNSAARRTPCSRRDASARAPSSSDGSHRRSRHDVDGPAHPIRRSAPQPGAPRRAPTPTSGLRLVDHPRRPQPDHDPTRRRVRLTVTTKRPRKDHAEDLEARAHATRGRADGAKAAGRRGAHEGAGPGPVGPPSKPLGFLAFGEPFSCVGSVTEGGYCEYHLRAARARALLGSDPYDLTSVVSPAKKHRGTMRWMPDNHRSERQQIEATLAEINRLSARCARRRRTTQSAWRTSGGWPARGGATRVKQQSPQWPFRRKMTLLGL